MRNVVILAITLIVGSGGAQAQEAKELYTEYCAACHGVQLEGQPDWMTRNKDGRLPAPPHDETGHTWHHSDRQLLTITRDGIGAISPGYKTDMPAFGDRLSDAEILAILDHIKSLWPKRERDYQRARSLRDPLDEHTAGQPPAGRGNAE